ncbi:hypothetical protein DMA15_30475 [Streptomyces sp. WAC 01529]|uniref:DUF6615 family protein n=1 Tax=Streptomyces sp. WAC 01529 TaxID=2203205 RepID=UPI000F6DECE7|nr:DUF6615 family protein [Streptomyces sp. WAC 01529]AZM56375.1 hypothetical protein DMA15_30475 [Streptomyces sp. WAC 01529]
MITPYRYGPVDIWPGQRPSLCGLLKWMASDTFHWLGDGYRHAPPPGEETFTDLHIRHLRQAMGHRLKAIQFTKRQESFNGADWELWIHNRSHGIGLRIQAKKQSRKGQYGFWYWLHERSALQCDLLVHDALITQCVPVYLLYNHRGPWTVAQGLAQGLCGHTASDQSHYGCTLLSAFHVQAALFRLVIDNDLYGHYRNISHQRLRQMSAPWNQVLCDVQEPKEVRDSRGVATLKEIQRRSAALEQSGLEALGRVDPEGFSTPSQVQRDHSDLGDAPELRTRLDETPARGDAQTALRPLPQRVLRLLEADDPCPPEPDVPTSAVVLYDVTDAEERLVNERGRLYHS